MKATTEDPRAPEPGTGPQPGEEEFLDATAHIPETLTVENRDEFKDQQQQQPATPAQPGWTAEEVASYFAGLFLLLSFPITRPLLGFGGEHWNIPDDKCQQLGRVWLPIFVKHIPYSRKPGMFADLVMWLPAIGAVKSVCTEPIKQEFALRRLEKQRAMEAAKLQRAGAVPGAAIDNGQGPRPTMGASMMASTATGTLSA